MQQCIDVRFACEVLSEFIGSSFSIFRVLRLEKLFQALFAAFAETSSMIA